MSYHVPYYLVVQTFPLICTIYCEKYVDRDQHYN